MEVIVNLTEREKKLMLSSLLFMGSVDFCLDDLDMIEVIDLAKKLSKEFDVKDLTDTELYLYGEVFEDEDIVKDVQENFKLRHEN